MRLLSKLADASKVQGASGAQPRSVYKILDEVSTGATQQFAAAVELTTLRLLSKLADASKVQGASGAQLRSVYKILDEVSTGATQQFAAAVEFGKKSMKKVQCAHLLAEQLSQLYPEAHCELHHETPLELLVATILSAQCTDVRVNQVTPFLFQRCKSTADYASISQNELETIIHSTGFFRNKATAIRKTAEALLERHQGNVPRSMEELTALPGVGRKTANVVLSNAFNIHSGIVVDTHVGRLAQRLGLTRKHQPIKIEQDLMKLFQKEEWGVLSHWLISHGRRRCYARRPDCTGCELRKLCPSVDSPT